ncbi:sugar phosphate isomerase/epimerase [Paenibacillus sp. GSMTC-2017]|uniref:sugar phosphate isomerase/epimerase family protein n=1 Tax=Paenibacillus sp. GSMTC-2017 TaxID=2794350 RepID=UPI0018D6D0DC|nr:sugar phosphate isomerase/epimerase family protein [Paenibacillus sp. GSMTC-2017]MBH5317032.1 sugar phosphate isomerase/epimerase [Paenibacillus sp. GSMTC-2017]
MLRGITSAGLGKIESDAQLIELAGRYGFQAVDLDVLTLTERYGIEGARQLLETNGVVIGSFGLPVEWRSTEEKFLEDFQKLASYAAAAQTFGCTRCCTFILPSTDHDSAHFMALAIRRLRQCAQLLNVYGIRLGLEFVGPHHLRTRWRNPFIWTMEETLDFIRAIDEQNVGLLLDSYHWYTTGLTRSHIESLRAEQIVHVHINDAPNVAIEEVLDNGRIYPGEGIIDLVGFLQSLQTIGYTGPVSQEVLTGQALAETPQQLIARSKKGFDLVFAGAGL